MRDKRFVVEHRGGLLQKAQHRQLIKWAYECAEHVLPLLNGKIDKRLKHALTIAREWEQGNASVGDARKASVAAHAAAREADDPVSVAVARSMGHAVATAHMADHSLGAALYALRAVQNAGGSVEVEAERKWQNEQLPEEIRELVLSTISQKEKSFKLAK